MTDPMGLEIKFFNDKHSTIKDWEFVKKFDEIVHNFWKETSLLLDSKVRQGILTVAIQFSTSSAVSNQIQEPSWGCIFIDTSLKWKIRDDDCWSLA